MLTHGQGVAAILDNMRQVAKGETWESIASGLGVGVGELQAANPDMSGRKLKRGEWLIVPAKSADPSPVLPEEGGEEQSRHALPEGSQRAAVSDLKVGVLLPFGDARMVEFYRGLLMAADSVRRDGQVNLEIHAWDCGTTVAQIDPLLAGLNGLDIVFGPASATQMPAVCETCKEQGTRLVLPFWGGQALLDYPLVYNATAPGTTLYSTAVRKMVSLFGGKNYVIVNSADGSGLGGHLRESVSQELSLRSATPRTLELEGDEFAYESAFNQFRDNVVIPPDSSIRSLNILTSRLKDFQGKHPQYRISLVGYPGWLNETSWLLGDLYRFDTYIISPYYYNVRDGRTKSFQAAYEKTFHTPIVRNAPCYAAFGFDLGCYFLGGVGSMGDAFEQEHDGILQNPYQSLFRFERSASGMSFTNSFVQFIHFTPDEKIELIR